MLKLFAFRYESLGERRRKPQSTSDGNQLNGAETGPVSSKKKSSKSKLPNLQGSKSTKHLELALKKKLTVPSLGVSGGDLNQDPTQRYTRFPTSTRQSSDLSFATHHDLIDSRSIDEPTHQRLVITSGHHSCRCKSNTVQTMPKNKPVRTAATGDSGASGDTSRPRNGSTDLDRTGSFMNKPARGWLHPDGSLSGSGICYGVRYVGCLEVTTSMKNLDFDTRSQIAKECINKVCESAGLKTVDKKRKVDKKIIRMLGEKTIMDFAGSNINLTITSRNLNLTIMESGELIAGHDMPNVSFASGGDPDTLDFVAYVAKDHMYGRACFVLECGGGLAQDVITTIGQAFELRFKQYLSRGPMPTNDPVQRSIGAESLPPMGDDPEYYNDLPGKKPPETPAENSNQLLKKIQSRELPPTTDALPAATTVKQAEPVEGSPKNEQLRKEASADNLIDLNQEIRAPSKKIEPEYVNCEIIAKSKAQNNDEFDGDHKGSENSESDPFDLQPFEGTLPSTSLLKPLSPVRNNFSNESSNERTSGSQSEASQAAQDQKQMLMQEIWFHGPISRKQSEALVVCNGDFLVRESQGSPGQYVLTGMQGGCKKHLLLVDPEGVVRTKDRTFESVSHLINYHCENSLPIIAADSALVLSNPIRMSK